MNRSTIFLLIAMSVILCTPALAGLKTDDDGNAIVKDVMASGGGKAGVTSPTAITLFNSIGQDIVGRSTDPFGNILIGGYINAWGLAGGGGVEVISYDFATSTEGWTYSTVTGYSLPSNSHSSSMLTLSSGNDETNRFGFWQTASDVITYEAGMIFRARYFIQTDQATQDNIPTIRLRFNTNDFSSGSAHSISSLASMSYAPPTAGTKEYRSLFYPVSSTDLGVSFDMLDFSPAEYGEIRLDQVIIEKIDRSLLAKVGDVQIYTTFGTWSWNANFSVPAWSGATSGGGTNYLSITSAASPQAAFWQSANNEMAYDTGTEYLYRASFEIERGSGDAAATMPWCRLRCFNEDSQMAQSMDILNGNSGAAAPPVPPASQAYEVYWQRPDLPGSPTTDEDGFKLAFDILNFGSGELGTYQVNQVDVEYFQVPAYSP